jgi:signal transduction histidine kinase
MKQRAKIIGARLDIAPTAAGTTLSLLLPVS